MFSDLNSFYLSTVIKSLLPNFLDTFSLKSAKGRRSRAAFILLGWWISFILFAFPAQAENSPLLIVEVQIAGDKPNNDFIKIYNPGNNDIDISGYKLRKRASTGNESSIRVFPKGSKILARDYFLWANSREDFHLTFGADVWSTATLSRNNSIALLCPENVILDALAWGKSQNPFVKGLPFPENPSANQQLKRKLINSSYQDTNNNSQDFYLSPLSEPSQPETQVVDVKHQQPNRENIIPTQKAQETEFFEEAVELGRIDINSASAKELQKIVGIGPVLAQRIIDARPFYSLEELTRISGISEKTLEDIKNQRLAWVDPTLEPPKTEKTEPSEKGLAAAAEPFNPLDFARAKQIPKSIIIFLIALGLAIFSGIIILILKKKLIKRV